MYGLGFGAFRHAMIGSIGGGGAFLPTDLSGLQLWLDASDFVSAGAISQWNDKSGLNNHLLQSNGANQPSVVLSVQNSKPIVRFDGVNDFFTLTSTISSTTDYTCVGVLKAFDGSSIVCGLSANLESVYPFLQFAGETYASDVNNYIFATNSVTSFCAITGTRTGTTKGLRKNNSPLSTSTVTIYRVGGDFSTFGRLTASFPTKGDFAELLYYNRLLTTQELTDIQTYLSTKWAL